MVLVSDFPGSDKGALGVLTLEDVIEELIGEEIIDESDVFVDVHKAVRRVTPAPKQRFKVNVPDAGVSDSDMESKAENGEDAPLLGRDAGSRHSSLPNGQQPAGLTTFLMRRKSSVGSDSTRDTLKPIPMRSNTTDLKQHLKHLGPSNAANKPRLTKFASVKIKPGVGTIPENTATTLGTDGGAEGRPEITQLRSQDSESFGLLAAAGPVASDGVNAVKAGYGSMGSSHTQRRLSNDSTQMTALEASREAEKKAMSPPPSQAGSKNEGTQDDNSLRVPEKLVVGATGDEDTFGEMSAPSRDLAKPRRNVRSGSITETTVEAGGMKKVVLETTSSSSDELDENGSVKASQTSSKNDGGQEERDQVDGGGAQEEGKRKKKRGKKKKNV